MTTKIAANATTVSLSNLIPQCAFNASVVTDGVFASDDMEDELSSLKESIMSGSAGVEVHQDGSVHGIDGAPLENAATISGDTFAADDMEFELSSLKESIMSGSAGVEVHQDGSVHGIDGAPLENAATISGDTFAADDMESELSSLKESIMSGSAGVEVHQDGSIHGIDGAPLENAATISGDTFAAGDMESELMDIKECLIKGKSSVVVDNDGTVHNFNNHPQPNGVFISGKIFGGDVEQLLDDIEDVTISSHAVASASSEAPVMPVHETNGTVDSEAAIAGNADVSPMEVMSQEIRDNLINASGEVQGGDSNATAISGSIFGAFGRKPQIPVPPSDPDQWYNKNHTLYIVEVMEMKKKFPNARLGFLKSNNCMYWTITMKILHSNNKPWTFFLVYQKDHPNNHSYGGSVKVVPVSPSYEELYRMARDYGRPVVPHVVNDPGATGKYLCTRVQSQVEDGKTSANTAVSSAAWAADWAAHFLLSLRDDEVWNKFVGNDEFYGKYRILVPRRKL